MIIGLVALVLFAALLIGGWMVFYNMNLQPVGTNTENVVVDIPDGSTIDEIAQILHDKNLIRNTLVFESYAGRHSRGSKQIQAANYEFNQAMSVPQIFNKMLNGEAYTGAVAITLPEGRNIKEMAEILEKNHVCAAADFIAETKKVTEYKAKYPILGSIPDGKDRTLEGYLFADTYNWGTGTEPSVIVTNMLDRFVDVYNASMEQRTQEMGKTVDEIVIMGSIVELETKLAEDKANCASVFYNRIAAGMPLQSDITVDYALGTKNAVLTEAQTQVDSPYNTYKNLGLPVGPICSPSKSSLEAALYPATTTYLFFVADMDSGKLYFNETLEGHNADVQKYMGD
ncbi:MAG: endolytic transglycosylase MltG [Eubacterium aggregans]|nr:endolytic transglycosylase MltG [Eubacterium aggregans]